MKDQIRLLLIDDNNLIRDGLVALLANKANLIISTTNGQKNEVEDKIKGFKPRIILLDAGLSSQNSLQLVKEVSVKYPDIRILLMFLVPARNEIIQFMDAGATGFIIKEANPQEFIKTIIAVARDEVILPLNHANLLLNRIVSHAISKGRGKFMNSVHITPFDLQLIKLLSEGLNNKEIGKKLGVSPRRIQSQIHNIKQNLFLFTLLEPLNGKEPNVRPPKDD